MVAARSLCPPPASGRRRIVQDTGCLCWRRLGSGLYGIPVAAASCVLLLLDDGGGCGGAGHRLATLRAPGLCRCLHGAAAVMGVSATEMGDVVRGGGVDGSNDARAPLLVELAWSGELLNRAPAWAATGSVGQGEGG